MPPHIAAELRGVAPHAAAGMPTLTQQGNNQQLQPDVALQPVGKMRGVIPCSGSQMPDLTPQPQTCAHFSAGRRLPGALMQRNLALSVPTRLISLCSFWPTIFHGYRGPATSPAYTLHLCG